MTRLLKLDPRPPAYDSVTEATVDERAAELVVDDVETADWRPIVAAPHVQPPDLAFVDGVQALEARVWAEGQGWPGQGIVVSYAAGAMCPGRRPPVQHVRVERRIILANGYTTSPLYLRAHNGVFEYRAESTAGDDRPSLDETLNQLRAALEAEIVRRLVDEGAGLVVVDGRLPPAMHGPAIGLIKTPHRLPLSKQEQIDVLMRLRGGERSPVFARERSGRRYYSWFIALSTCGPLDVAMSNLALIEMDDAPGQAEAVRMADMTAAVLPSYASTPGRDDRAPQNLLPVGQLERELRHRLGDRELMKRLLVEAFTREAPGWNP